MQVEEGSSMDPWSIFLYGMKAPMTREKYGGRLAKFFDFIGLKEGTMEERAKAFTERGKKEPDWVFVNVMRFAQTQKVIPDSRTSSQKERISQDLVFRASWNF
jgi:hypothetical protein